jgi:hypothetical protein
VKAEPKLNARRADDQQPVKDRQYGRERAENDESGDEE